MDDVRHSFPFLIAAIAIVMGMGMAFVALMLDFRKKSQLLELHHKERMLALEKGIELPPLPPEFFENGRGRRWQLPESPLRRGLLLVFVGTAAAFALLINGGFGAAVWGFIPVAAGLAYLVSYWTGERASPAEGRDAH